MLKTLFNLFRRKTIQVAVQAVRRSCQGNRSGKAQWNLKAIVNGVCVCQMTLAAVYSPAQYEQQLSKLLAKIYRRYRWLVGAISYLPAVDRS